MRFGYSVILIVLKILSMSCVCSHEISVSSIKLKTFKQNQRKNSLSQKLHEKANLMYNVRAISAYPS
jgi:hypothetical protein